MLCEKNDCTGCMACFSVCTEHAVSMKEAAEGFLYPVIDARICKKCGKCSSVCPMLNSSEKKGGYTQKSYAAYSKNRKIRRSSSSGGIFSEIANSIIDRNGIVFGAAFNENFSVCHVGIDTKDNLRLLRGSKYVQSNINNSYIRAEQYLNKKRAVLFSGTPCQIAGLYSYLNCNHETLYTIDLVCHGVPSPLIFFEYKKWLEKKHGKLIDYFFRDKKWSWQRFNIKADFYVESPDVKNLTNRYLGTWEEDPYMRGFLRDYYLRKSCHVCRYAKIDRTADITLADFWGYRDTGKTFKERDKGISLVLVNTSRGEQLFKEIKERICCIEAPISWAVKGNRALSSCFPPAELRGEFWADFNNKGFEYLIEKYLYSEKIPFSGKILYKHGKYSPVYFFVFNMERIIRKLKELFSFIKKRGMWN
jgi:coenzyme F420-reducing hydrogenase beta subunit